MTQLQFPSTSFGGRKNGFSRESSCSSVSRKQTVQDVMLSYLFVALSCRPFHLKVMARDCNGGWLSFDRGATEGSFKPRRVCRHRAALAALRGHRHGTATVGRQRARASLAGGKAWGRGTTKEEDGTGARQDAPGCARHRHLVVYVGGCRRGTAGTARGTRQARQVARPPGVRQPFVGAARPRLAHARPDLQCAATTAKLRSSELRAHTTRNDMESVKCNNSPS